jgi:DNA-binding IclR family transcriptional regulator
MRRLRDQFEDTVNLAILEQGQIRCIEVLESSQRFKIVANPGEHDPVHCAALGKAMLAYLPEHEDKTILEVVSRFRAVTPRYTSGLTSGSLESMAAFVML